MTNFGPRDGGLAAERTALAWTRTLLAVLANGALLMARSNHGYNGSIRLFAVGLAVTLALTTCLIGRRRQRTLAHRPLPQRITPRHEVYLVGISVLVLILVAAVALPI
ncbi:MAG: hypothetical protein JWQ86_3240 [Mycobacterium sp.]|jgi:uncharacterized membrane protein YidH (DUF202 family)|nr:hypothetical protein [Mycobacterium sp.]